MRPPLLFACLLAIAALGGRAPAAAQSAAEIPVAALFSNPTLSSPRLAPDGKHIAILYSNGDRQLAVVRPSVGNDMKSVAAFLIDETRLSWLGWANSDRILISAHSSPVDSKESRSRVTRLFGVDRTGGPLDWLGRNWETGGRRAGSVPLQDTVIHFLPDDPQHVLISYHVMGKLTPSLMRMNVTSGEIIARRKF